MGIEILTLQRFLRKLRGGSQPILAQASDGALYVVKCAGGFQGPNLMFNESIGTELYRACGLAVAEWRTIQVDDRFLDANPTCWFESPEKRIRPVAGLCFGSRLAGQDGYPMSDILPGTAFRRIRNRSSFWLAWLIDVCASHSDVRQAIFKEYADWRFEAIFIDHGHLFSGPGGMDQPLPLASRYLDPRIYGDVSKSDLRSIRSALEALDANALRTRVVGLPAGWRTESALMSFEQCLERLKEPRAWETVLSELRDLQERSSKSERTRHVSKIMPSSALLCP